MRIPRPLKQNNLRVISKFAPNRVESSFNVYSTPKAAAAAAKRPFCCNPWKVGTGHGSFASRNPAIQTDQSPLDVRLMGTVAG